MPFERFVPGFLLLLGAVGTVPVVRSLWVADLNLCYPYLSSDSYDWIYNGLYWAGEAARPSFRPPGLPLIIALLSRLGILSWLPLLNFFVLGVTAWLLYVFLRDAFSPTVSALAAWIFYANGFSQDLARWVLAEVWATPLLVLAAMLFARSQRRPALYAPFGLALGAGFLFHYAALPAAIGFAAVLVSRRRPDLRLRSLWLGALAGGAVAGAWVVTRSLQYRRHPGSARHGVEALIAFAPENIRFYLFAGTALLGLLVLPLYARGALRFMEPSRPGSAAFREATWAPLIALGISFGAFYNWTDKRFLFYLFPFLAVLLAAGIEAALEFSRVNRPLRVVVGGYLAAALLWNQIQYPGYGFQYIALTPRDFLQASVTQDRSLKSTLHLAGARVMRLHASLLSSFSRGLFDFRLRSPECPLSTPEYACLVDLRREADRFLAPGEPIGLETPPGWPADYYASLNRLGNSFRRPVILPKDARLAFVGRESARSAPLASCGPYALVATR